MKQLYTLLFMILAPLLWVRLQLKGRKLQGYREHIGERFGLYLDPPATVSTLWIHAVSVGECEAAFPLVKRLLMTHPGVPIVMTMATPTGRQRVSSVLGSHVRLVYLPYDIPMVVERFLHHYRPALGWVMETEIWPNLFDACERQGIPLLILNGRLSEKSALGYERLRSVISKSLQSVNLILAQTSLDAERYGRLGAIPVTVKVMGNIKFDNDFDEEMVFKSQQLRSQFIGDRPVWIVGSSHFGEEELCLDAFQYLRLRVPDALLILVPRHPERSGEVRKLCEARGFVVMTRSAQQNIPLTTPIFIIDGVGELRLFYGAADVATVGGSLVPHGGQNPLEPLAAGIPVTFGPYMMNFKDIAQQIVIEGAGRQVKNWEDLGRVVADFLEHPLTRADAALKGSHYLMANRGSLDRLQEAVNPWLERCFPVEKTLH